MATDNTLVWQNLDPATLPTGLRAAYDEYKQFQREAAKAREAFETAFAEMVPLPSSQSYVFGYKFGKLSFAITDAPAKRPAKPSRALDFATLAAMSGAPRSL